MNEETPRTQILVVDDEEYLQEMTVNFVSAMGHEAVAASNGKEALQLLERYPEKFTVLITDYQMPELNGIGLIRKAINLKIAPSLIVMISSLVGNSDEIASLLIEEPQIKTLQKPFAREDLLNILREHHSLIHHKC